MPFDDTTRPTDTVRILDEVIAVLGPKGERWSQRVYHNRKGQHCYVVTRPRCIIAPATVARHDAPGSHPGPYRRQFLRP